MPWANPRGKNSIDNWVANALGFFYIEYDVLDRFNNKKHAEVFKKMTEELEHFIDERVKHRLKEIEKA